MTQALSNRIVQAIHTDDRSTPEGLPDGGVYRVLARGVNEHDELCNVEVLRMEWQRGPLVDPVTGESLEPNGLFLETAVRACVARLKYYQTTKFSCRENAIALTHLETTLLWLGARADRRLTEGTLGTHAPDKKP